MRINRFGVSPYPPRLAPVPPVPEVLGDGVQHGINCVCVAEHFGLDVAEYRSTSGCGMPEREYRKTVKRAQRLQLRSKTRRLTGHVDEALEDLRVVHELGEQLDSPEMVLAAASDASEVLFGIGRLAEAEQLASFILDVTPMVQAGAVWVQAGATLRQIEECRDVAERTMTRILVDRGAWDDAQVIIDRQRERFGTYRSHHDVDPAQVPAGLVAHHLVMDLLLRFEEVHIAIGRGDRVGAEQRCERLLEDVRAMRADPPASPDATQNLPAIEAEVTMQLEVLRLHAGRFDVATAGLARLAAELRAGGVVEHDSPAMHAALGELALAGGVQVGDGDDLQQAGAMIEQVREFAVQQQRPRDVGQASAQLGSLLLAAGRVEEAAVQLEHAHAVLDGIGDGVGLRGLLLVEAALLGARQDWEGLDALVAQATGDGAVDAPTRIRLDTLRASSLVDRGAGHAAALAEALPAALAADAMRYAFYTELERTAWSRAVAAPVMAVAVEIAVRAGDERVLAELVERMAQVGAVTVVDSVQEIVPTMPTHRSEVTLAASLAGAHVHATTRLAPPRPLRWTPSEGSVLAAAERRAAERYGVDASAGEAVPTW